jgi:hypothetical protein
MSIEPGSEAYRGYLQGRASLHKQVSSLLRTLIEKFEAAEDEADRALQGNAALVAMAMLCDDEEKWIAEQYAAWKVAMPDTYPEADHP